MVKNPKLVNVVCERPLRRCAAEVLSSSPPQFPPKKLSECSYLLTCFTVISQISLVELLAFSIYWIKIIEWYWWHIFFTSNEWSSWGFVLFVNPRVHVVEDKFGGTWWPKWCHKYNLVRWISSLMAFWKSFS